MLRKGDYIKFDINYLEGNNFNGMDNKIINYIRENAFTPHKIKNIDSQSIYPYCIKVNEVDYYFAGIEIKPYINK